MVHECAAVQWLGNTTPVYACPFSSPENITGSASSSLPRLRFPGVQTESGFSDHRALSGYFRFSLR